MKTTRITLTILLALALAAGCGDDVPGDPGPDADTGQPSPAPPATPDPDPIPTKNCGALTMDLDRNIPGLVDGTAPDATYYTRDPSFVEMTRYKGTPGGGGSPVSPEHLTLLSHTIVNAEVALGQTPDHTDDTQLATALGPAIQDIGEPVQIQHGFNVSGFAVDGDFAVTTAATSAIWRKAIRVPQGCRIKGIRSIGFDDATPGPTEATLSLYRLQGPIGNAVQVFAQAGWGTAFPVNVVDDTFADELVDNQMLWYVEAATPAGWDGTKFSIQQAWITIDTAGT